MSKYTPKLSRAAENAVQYIDELNARGIGDFRAYEAGIEEVAARMKNDIVTAASDYDPALPTFYISESGSDENDGRSPETAWRSIAKANEKDATPEHCNILFERGGVFRGEIIAPHDYITYSAYGKGKKPCIYGSRRNYADPALWEATEYPNVYRTTACGRNAGIVAFNHSPEYGRYDEIVGIRAIRGLNGFEGPAQLRRNYQVYANLEKEELFLCCTFGNPGEVFDSIEIGERQNTIHGGHHIKIDNLCVKFSGAHGVAIGGNNDYTVQNCIFAYLGGSILPGHGGGNVTGYGNAVQVYGSCDGYYVNGNWIYQIYDTAITHQYSGWSDAKENHMRNVEYIGNLCEYCHWSIEYYNPNSNAYPDTPRTVSGVNVAYNLLRYGAYGWGSEGRCEGGALFNSFGMTRDTSDFTAEHNILDRSRGNLVRLNLPGDKALEGRGNTFIQKEGRAFGFCFGAVYPFTRDKAQTYAEEYFHDKDARIIFSLA